MASSSRKTKEQQLEWAKAQLAGFLNKGVYVGVTFKIQDGRIVLLQLAQTVKPGTPNETQTQVTSIEV